MFCFVNYQRLKLSLQLMSRLFGSKLKTEDQSVWFHDEIYCNCMDLNVVVLFRSSFISLALIAVNGDFSVISRTNPNVDLSTFND